MHKEKLAALRVRIDEVDRGLIELFQKRMQISEQVADVKSSANLSLTDEKREHQVIENAVSIADESNKSEVAAFMQSLIALSKIKQRYKLMPATNLHFPQSGIRKNGEIKVAFQGVHGAWGEMGAMKMFPQTPLTNLEYFEDVFEAVKSKTVDFGVLPIENSQSGAIGEVYDLLRRHGCFIVGQTWVPINQCLLAKPGSSLDGIREILSHPQGFSQCRRFLKNRNWELVTCRNTAVAAQMVSEREDLKGAAIGSRQAAEHYGLEVLAPDIFDQSGNQTRFIAISSEPLYDEACDTISVTFSLLNKSGALCAVLQSFMLADMNLTRLESRPASADRYRFFADLQANILNEKTLDTLKEAAVQCEYFEILGCYSAV